MYDVVPAVHKRVEAATADFISKKSQGESSEPGRSNENHDQKHGNQAANNLEPVSSCRRHLELYNCRGWCVTESILFL